MATQLHKEIKAELKAQKKAKDGNMLLDRMLQGAGAAGILFLAWYELLGHIRATEPVNYGLAALGILFLLYLVTAPSFRR